MVKKAFALRGLRIIVTRSEEDALEFIGKLRELGAIVYELPCITIRELEVTDQKKSILDRLDSFSWVMFTSVHAVTAFSKHAGSLLHTQIAVVGPKTKQVVEQKGFPFAFMPSSFTGHQLALTLPALPGESILWPCAEEASSDVEEVLQKRNIALTTLPLYATEIITHPDEKITDLIRTGQIDYSTCMSGSSVRGLVARVFDPNARKKLLELPLVSIGPKTTAVAKKYGFTKIVEAQQHTVEGIIDILKSIISHHQS